MTLDQARNTIIHIKDDCTRYIYVGIKKVPYGYEVDPNGYSVSDWFDGATVEAYTNGALS